MKRDRSPLEEMTDLAWKWCVIAHWATAASVFNALIALAISFRA
jgi:hypothetical protein